MLRKPRSCGIRPAGRHADRPDAWPEQGNPPVSSTPYQPPLGAQRFLLERVLGWDQLFRLPRFAHSDPDVAGAVLEEGARFAAGILAPLNATGDQYGSQLIDGRVRTPPGFAAAFQQFAAGGWAGLDLPRQFGGHGLPLSVQAAFAEMVNGACVSFGMLPTMLRAGAWLLIEHGNGELAQLFVPQLAAGLASATICITEPQAGSDVARIRTRAVPGDGDHYALTGAKIFITWADHEFTDQIVHLVLARTGDAAAGTRGLSLFAVPRLRPADGGHNGISVRRVEHKMGLKASPTCALDLDGAIGYRIGTEGRGLQCLFTMVNLMRLEVAVQGVALAAAATRRALQYASERRQGGAAIAPPVAIIRHADVRRMLLIMRARTEALRALVFEAAFQLDLAHAARTEAERTAARQLAEFLLPVCKTCGAEAGFEIASLALQVFGGHGYVTDTGVEQYLRDSRIMAIYEGTSGIQALDLVNRRLVQDDATRYRLFAARIHATLHECRGDPALGGIREGLSAALAILERCSMVLLAKTDADRRDLEAAATDYLQLVGLVGAAWMWLRMAAAADRTDARQRELAEFFVIWLLPEAAVREARIVAGAAPIDALPDEALRGGC